MFRVVSDSVVVKVLQSVVIKAKLNPPVLKVSHVLYSVNGSHVMKHGDMPTVPRRSNHCIERYALRTVQSGKYGMPFIMMTPSYRIAKYQELADASTVVPAATRRNDY